MRFITSVIFIFVTETVFADAIKVGRPSVHSSGALKYLNQESRALTFFDNN